MRYVDLLSPRALRTGRGIELRVRSPLTRSVPLSVVSVSVAVDGTPVEPERVRFCVNDCDYALDELPQAHDASWFVLDPGRLRVDLENVRDAHDVEVQLDVRPPFTPVADRVPVRSVERRRVVVL